MLCIIWDTSLHAPGPLGPRSYWLCFCAAGSVGNLDSPGLLSVRPYSPEQYEVAFLSYNIKRFACSALIHVNYVIDAFFKRPIF